VKPVALPHNNNHFTISFNFKRTTKEKARLLQEGGFFEFSYFSRLAGSRCGGKNTQNNLLLLATKICKPEFNCLSYHTNIY
jgi:hypothetical protein